jgi:subtilase family serine protease
MSKRAALFLTTLCAAASIAPAALPTPAQAALPLRLEAIDRGPTNAKQIITITVHLAKPDEAGFQKVLADLYDRTSPRFHKWLTDDELRQFAPPAEQRDAVKQALEAGGLTVISFDKDGFSIRARGAAGDVARAFNTEIHDFTRNGELFRRNISPARLDGAAAAYVHTVAGLESHTVHPMLTRQVNLLTGKAPANIPLNEVRPGLGKFITDQILSPSQSFTYPTPGETLPTATYTGVVYASNPNLVADYSPRQLEKVYGLLPAYAQGLNGTGQTIVLLEAYGYPTIEADANAFFKLTHLPQLTSSNFNIVYPEGVPNSNNGILTGWNIEIALDVQSSHSIAPGANTLVVATNGQDNEDFQYSMQYIIDNNLGSTVSDSWEEDTDLVAGPAEQESFEDVLELAAAKGISFQFSCGDGGDGGLGTPLGAPGVPSVAPHATAVGGTAILNNVGGAGFTPTGWGDGLSLIASSGPVNPPESSFYAGGGGGESVFWPKPDWQASLPGVGRQTPDVSALGDPFTGVPIVVTDSTTGQKLLEPGWGGTSLSSPIFTAFWAIAQQAVGGPLGQASPTIAVLTKGIRDVLPIANANDITGSITTSSGTTDYSTLQIFGTSVVEQNTIFTGAIWNIDPGVSAYGIGFALDSSLTVTPGWDNQTGYGTPEGLAFIKAVAASVGQ